MYNWKDTRNYRRFRDENGNVIANIIYVDGEEVAVSDEVYEAYASMDRRERYLTDESDTPQDLSFERCVEDHVPFELLYENGRGSLEEDLERKEMLCILHKALQSIPAEEQEFIRELFFLHRTTREECFQKAQYSAMELLASATRYLRACFMCILSSS